MGPDGLIDLIKTWRTAFPDGRMEIDDLIVEGDTVAIRNTWYGTQTRPVLRHPAERQVGRGHLGRDRPRPGRPGHRGLGRARHGRDDAADGCATHRRPRRGRGRGRPDVGPDLPRAAAATPARRRRTEAACAASSRRSRTRTPRAPERSSSTAAFVDHSPGWGTSGFDSVLAVQSTLGGDARPALRARRARTWSARAPRSRRTPSFAARTRAKRSSAPSPPARSSSGRTATSCACRRQDRRALDGHRHARRSSSRPACFRRWRMSRRLDGGSQERRCRLCRRR